MRDKKVYRTIRANLALLIFVAAGMLPALACNLPGQANPFWLIANTPIPTFTLAPTNTFPPPTAMPPPPTATITLTPTYSPGFQEGFENPLDRWSDYVVVTKQAIAGRLQSTFSQKGGILTLNMVDKETYLYRFYNSPQPKDIYVEFEFIMDGQKDNAAALICRAAEDQSSWYESRISGNGDYAIYRYSKARKTDQGLNPYVLINQGKAPATAYEPGKQNVIRFTCQGNQLSLDFNLGRERITAIDDGISSGGFAGFGAMTYSNLPVTIQIDEVNAGLP